MVCLHVSAVESTIIFRFITEFTEMYGISTIYLQTRMCLHVSALESNIISSIPMVSQWCGRHIFLDSLECVEDVSTDGFIICLEVCNSVHWCFDVSPSDVLGVVYYFSHSVPVLNWPDVSPSDVLGVVYYFSLSVPVLNCPDVSPSDVLGVGYYFSLSLPVLNCPDVSSSDVLGVFYYFSLSVPVLNCPDVLPSDVLGCKLLFQSLHSTTELTICFTEWCDVYMLLFQSLSYKTELSFPLT